MDFAQKQLEKYGWSEGKGLGKEMQGNKDHVKVSLKNDKDGLGKTEDWGFTWWDSVFNKTSSQIQIETEGDEVKVKMEEKKALQTLYNGFVKAGNTQEKEDHSIRLTDAELFEACGRRRVRKGARGLHSDDDKISKKKHKKDKKQKKEKKHKKEKKQKKQE
ncbi:hypothetical protein EDD86DRAFT_186946 [Gorgonomyces haynaldii]|nr:hypothetical protein EDD86DRAFT_186946 [Gorgonomyces haynaldii]